MRYLLLLFPILLFSCSKEKEKEHGDPKPDNTLSDQEVLMEKKNAGLYQELFFLDELTGYAISRGGHNEIFKTTDGGKNWNLSLTANWLSDLEFLTTDRGILSANLNENFPPFYQSHGPMITQDGGGSWQMAFKDSNIYIFDDCAMPKLNTIVISTMIGIMRTEDNGLSWDTVMLFSDSLLGYKLSKICFVDENIGYTGTRNALFKTTDGGKSWTFHVGLNFPDDSLVPVEGLGGNMFFFSESHGMIHKGKYYFTSDGGQSWYEPIFSGNESGEHQLGQASFATENVIYFTGTQGIYKSTDAGLTYKLVNRIINHGIAYKSSAIFMLDENTGFVSAYYFVGSSDVLNGYGVLLKTANGWK